MPTSFEHDPSDVAADDLLAHAVVDPSLALAEADRQHARRRRQRIAATLAAFALFVVVAITFAQLGFSDTTGGSKAPAPKVAVTGEAVGVLVLRPGTAPERIAASHPVVGAAVTEHATAASWGIDGVARVQRATTSARVGVAVRRSSATAAVASVDLFDGRIQLTNASLQASASSSKGVASGELELGPGATLTVDGEPTAITPNQQIAIEGIGTVLVNEQAVLADAPRGDAQTGPRHREVGALVHVRITQDTATLPAGTQIIVGRVDAGVREGKIKQVAHPPTGTDPAPVAPAPTSATTQLQPGTPAPGQSTLPRRPTAVRGNSVAGAAAGLGSYLFPVLGVANFSNDWGAPRASTGVPHQGTDIFAAEGTPIVAVADGVLDRVGWNAIGGYRFWLFDAQGNSFYHAHLSAYSPLAKDGARVRRGDVIGFVGHTGDAQYTPPHLHFEVHPGNGAATNPFPFLGAWKRGVAVAIGLLTTGPERTAPLALLNFTDITTNSGLQDSVLDAVPDTRARSIEQEQQARPTDEALKGAIEGPGTSAAE